MKLEEQIRKEEGQKISAKVRDFNAKERRIYFEAYADGLLYIRQLCKVSYDRYFINYN